MRERKKAARTLHAGLCTLYCRATDTGYSAQGSARGCHLRRTPEQDGSPHIQQQPRLHIIAAAQLFGAALRFPLLPLYRRCASVLIQDQQADSERDHETTQCSSAVNYSASTTRPHQLLSLLGWLRDRGHDRWSPKVPDLALRTFTGSSADPCSPRSAPPESRGLSAQGEAAAAHFWHG